MIACHEIAAYLYQLDDGIHKHTEWTKWRAKKRASLPENAHGRERTKCGSHIPFYATLYVDPDRFRNGLADVVGYWAEYQIFGGVVLLTVGRLKIR